MLLEAFIGSQAVIGLLVLVHPQKLKFKAFVSVQTFLAPLVCLFKSKIIIGYIFYLVMPLYQRI